MTSTTRTRTTRIEEPATLYEMGLPGEWQKLLQKARAEGCRVRACYANRQLHRGGTKKLFPVYGSTGTPYMVNLTATSAGILVGCTCAAGTHGRKCKHAAAVLSYEMLLG